MDLNEKLAARRKELAALEVAAEISENSGPDGYTAKEHFLILITILAGFWLLILLYIVVRFSDEEPNYSTISIHFFATFAVLYFFGKKAIKASKRVLEKKRKK